MIMTAHIEAVDISELPAAEPYVTDVKLFELLITFPFFALPCPKLASQLSLPVFKPQIPWRNKKSREKGPQYYIV
jgi:hypothetical protein